MDDMTPLVDTLYARFADRAAPPDLGVCLHCCMPPDVERAMLATTPRALTTAQMREWFSAAASPTASLAVTRFLLPRVIDGLARNEEMSDAGIEVTLRRFAPLLTEERARNDTLDTFMRAFLTRHMHHTRAGLMAPYLDDILCMFALGGWPPADLADALFAHPPEVLVHRFWDDWCKGARYPGIWQTAFWPDKAVSSAFYADPRLETAFDTILADAPADTELFKRACGVSEVLMDAAPR